MIRLRSRPFPIKSLIPFFAFLFVGMFALLTSVRAQNSDVAGEWKGEIKIPGHPLGVEVILNHDAAWSGTYNIPAQGITGFLLEKITVNAPNVSFKLGGGIEGEPTFTLHLSADGSTLDGTFSQAGATFPAALKRASAGTEEGSEVTKTTTPEVTPEELKSFLADLREKWNIPGMAVAVVRGDQIFLSEGFGGRDVENHLPVTPSTLFAIGSTTKAFTSVIIGTLIDEGKLDWDTPLIDYLPDFRLQDDYATTHLTVRDLLTHVSGLPRHDLLWYGADFNREELFSRLRYLEPTAELRQKWQYQNLMFMTAGILAERVTGKSWEELVRERIFAPLGISHAKLSIDEMKVDANFSQPYTEEDGKIAKIDFRSLDAIAPAGGINAGVEEMAAWIRLNLSDGEFNGKRVISKESLQEIQTPSVVISGQTNVEGLMFNLYGMGWMISSYRGHRLVHHGGGIDGFVTEVAMLPDDHIGIVILTNRPTGLPEMAMLDIADRMLRLEPLNHAATALSHKEIADQAETGPNKEKSEDDILRVKGTKPTYPLSEYEGGYEHSAYGAVRIFRKGSDLFGLFHGDTVKLEHYHYDVFRASEEEGAAANILIAFQPSTQGGVAALTLPLEPTIAPIRFEKSAPEQLRDPNYLKRFAGTYNLASQKVTVSLRDSALTVFLPGQPLYTLTPLKESAGAFAEFSINGLEGFHIRFQEEKGTVKRALFLQPNGTFVAEKE